MKYVGLLFVSFSLIALCFSSPYAEEWNVIIPSPLKDKPAIHVALDTLQKTCEKYHIQMNILSGKEMGQNQNTIIALERTDRSLLSPFPAEIQAHFSSEIPSEGFIIQTTYSPSKDARILLLVGGSDIGTAYGLFWIVDRLQVYRTIPEINIKRAPAFPIRIASAWGRHLNGGATEQQLNISFRYGFNWVSGMNILDLVPWNAEPENTINRQHIEQIKPIIEKAHALGMRYFAFSNELTYHPSLFNNDLSLLNPCQPEFWERVKEKYRLLFTALPELDGIEICLDDISGFWDNYHPFDILHDCPQCTMSYEERYKKLLQTIHEVVVDEFGKTYFHKNWGLRDHEIHCQPEVFKHIFTDEVPTDNMFVMIKITRADRWWFQPYNRTFNLSPHKTIVIFETMNYYEGADTNLFPTFSGTYFQNGLKYFLSAENPNVSGFSFLGGVPAEDWSTKSAYIYTLYRLLWEPNVDIAQVARDYCAINLGPEVAEPMADILMDTANAYKYGLFIEPIAYGQFNSLPHMRVGTFVAEGYPLIDLGKGHIQFLRNIYFQCLPWREFTQTQLRFGLNKAEGMVNKYQAIKEKMPSQDWATQIETQLNMTYSLIDTHYHYIDTMFCFFDYLDDSSPENKNRLQTAWSGLKNSLETFKNLPGFNYKLDGVNVLFDHTYRALQDIHTEKKLLERIPPQKEIDRLVQNQQEIYKKILEEHKGVLKKLGHFEILIDGQDLIHIQGDKYRIEHLRWDGPELISGELFFPLPQKEVLVIPDNIDTRPIHPFVLYQPTASNNYETTLYLDDRPGGTGRFVFDLYVWDTTDTDLHIIKNWSEYFNQ